MSLMSTDLRIGNWIWNNDYESNSYAFQQVTASILVAMAQIEYACGESLIEPLQIDHRVLINTGFQRTVSFWLKTKDRFGDSHSLELSEHDPGEWTVYFRNFNKDKEDGFVQFVNKIQYIHQLQNLYFALYGEELNIVL